MSCDTKVKISIIIPVYNAGRSILRCLCSVSRQTFKDYEVIVIDDGSKDASASLAEKYIARDEILNTRARVISKPNSGVADTRNYGITLAEGEYLAFIDQDDFIARDYLERYYRAASLEKFCCRKPNSGADIVVGGYERIASDGRIITRVIPKPSDWAGYIVTAPWAHLFKTDFIRNNELKFLKNKIGEDVYFNVVALNCGANVEVINDSGYKWYYNTESVSNSVQNTFKDDVDVIYLMDSIVDAIGDNTYSPYLEYFFLRYVCWYMLFSTRGSRKLDIDKVYSKCFAWIGKNFPDYRKSKYIGTRMPKGENPKFHAFVFVFYLLERIHILKPVLKMFGK
ncbi:Glycosyl transferase family 2 [Lachnospiraceae bacterium NE2001]|nr:Glycosyl transferase family 2 [Lachnospiraceae bacterium NE2001]